jgi:subfamily B ATP-binding cassette protein HlyB/CyaB
MTTSHADGGFAALLIVATLHDISADDALLAHEFGHRVIDGRVEDATLLAAARRLGMSARVVAQDRARLDRAPLPAIGRDRDGRCFVLAAFERPRGGPPIALIQYPGQAPETIGEDALCERWSGRLIYFKSKASYAGEMARFDFTWFVPAIVRYRRLLGDVLLISLVLQLIGLVTPLFFQVVMDKVLVNHALNTLDVVALGLVVATLFEAALTGIRSWIFAHTSSKIDVELGSRLFRHLVSLPLSYFQARRVGDSVARVKELENIRSFLTGNAMTVVMDLVFSVLFIALMFLYSVKLTLVVLLSIPAYAVLSFTFTPVLRQRLDDKFTRNAENQSFLVESISGIDTVKAMAVEPRWVHRWEEQLAGYVRSSLRVVNAATIASGGVSLVSKLVTAAILWLGASDAVQGLLSVGQLVAFNMLANQVSSPVLRLAQLWNDFQQVGISMKRLGDILNARSEIDGQRTRLPALEGAITFENVAFRYRPDAPDVIRGVSLDIRAGEVVGIVGRSGSGKSTLTKLVQRLYVPDRGRVLVDGQDIAVVDSASLRTQIGVVLQENTLFSRSVRENIALSNPALPLDAVIAAAKMAGAHDFICQLPQGYDTLIGEHGTGLSGGQRQRVAIARALITDPRVLIFDEATSALDYESERVIQDNMRQICRGRTVLVIAHRLSAVRDADRIVVMEKGEVAEVGSHDELLRLDGGIYAQLHALQHGGPPRAAAAAHGAPAAAGEPAASIVEAA